MAVSGDSRRKGFSTMIARARKWIVETLGLALLYGFGAKLGFFAAIQPGNVTVLWVPSGLAVAGILTLGPRALLGLWLGSFGVNFWFLRMIVPLPLGTVVAMAIAVGSSAQAILVVRLLKHFQLFADLIDYVPDAAVDSAAQHRPPLVKESLLFLVIVALACFVASFIGVVSLSLADLVSSGAYLFTWATWWLGDSMGILVVLPLLLVLVRRQTGKPPGHTVLHVVRSVGFCLSVALALVAFTMELQRITAEFEADAAPIARNYDEIIRACRFEVSSIADFVDASDEVTRDEFRRFTKSRLTGDAIKGGLQALSLNPRVLASERAAYELAIQSEGFPGFRITEPGVHGELVAAKDRPEYFVVKYVEPHARNVAILGYDSASEPARWAASIQARDTGNAIATAPIKLLQTFDSTPGILLFQPIYQKGASTNSVDERRASLTGFAAGAFRTSAMIDAAIGGNFPGIDLYLFDLDLAPHECLVYATSGDSHGDTRARILAMNPRLDPTELEVGMHYATTIDIVGRRWRMIAKPTRAYITNRRTSLPWELLALSLGLSMVVVVYLARRLEVDVERSVLLAAEKKQRLLAETSTELTRQLLQKSERLAEDLRAEQALLARRVEERTADLRVTNEELMRAAQAKDEFLANMSHELRTPLNSVLGFSEILLAELQGPINEKQRTFLQYIGSSGQHLIELINDILDIAKDGAGKLQLQNEAVHVHEVCKSSLRAVEETTNRKRITLSFHADGLDGVFAWLDPKRLKQILLNLLGNAVKFTADGGSVSLEVHADAKGKVLRFAVRDTGPGIASDDMSRLFQPFSQLDTRLSREHEGSGLGLMIVRRMVDMLQGSVTVESELGSGSCFTVALPWRLSERPSRQEIVVSSRLPPQSQRGRILLVEDNESSIALMMEYLQAAGYLVRIARNGYEALDRALEFMPEVILMDIQLPRLDGLEVTRRLRQMALFTTTPIIAVTALVMPGDCERCLAAGANHYLSKPVSLEDLAAKMRAMLAGIREKNAQPFE